MIDSNVYMNGRLVGSFPARLVMDRESRALDDRDLNVGIIIVDGC